MIPFLNNKFTGSWLTLYTTLLIAVVCVTSFAILEASAQVSSSETFNLRVRSEPNILFISGGGDYASGTEVKIDPAPEKFEDYTFVGWQIDGRWADGNPITVRMDNSHSAVAIYSKELSGSITIDAIPRIAEITVDGTIYLPDELPLSFSWLEGSSHIISIPATIKESSDKRYVFDSWKDKNTESDRTITVGTEPQNLIALFKTQHYLKPISQYGTVLGGGWQDAGKTATFELESDIVIDKKDPSIRYVFESWDSGDYQNLPTNNIDIEDDAATVKAIWDTQYFVKLTTDIPDYELAGTGWYTSERKLALIADESLESPDSNIKYVFERWVSKGPNPVVIPEATSPITQITVSEPYVIEAKYKKSYLVNVWTPYGDAEGSGFYDEGSVAEIKISKTEEIVEPNRIKVIFAGWNTNGAKTVNVGPADTISPASPQNLLISVDKPETITANWNTQYYLDVQSVDGKTRGSGWYELGRMVPISVDTLSTPPGMWSVKAFDKWTGDIDSTSMNERVLMNKPKTVIAEFKQDSSPGIVNAIILAAAGGIGIIVYTKTHSKFNFKLPKIGSRYKQQNPFESYGDNPFEADYQIPKITPKKKAVMDWLMGK
jgi:hypothetical protein